ncbi:MAG: class II fructose-bisphosphate aldolase [Candidatus Berkelbacteria bacterium]|nr:class II fructose-bisphosphate aldolase [Candidatus Berkelbacteria bacterium]
MFTNPKELLIEARRGGYALGHFNVFNMESAKAVITAIAESEKPGFVAITETTIRYAGLGLITCIVKELSQMTDGDNRIIMHLDHGKSVEMAKKCIEAGFTSAMIDASALDFEENIELTSKVVVLAHGHGVSVESEIGHVGRVGEIIPKHYLTNPSRAEEFVERTGVDSVAVAIGTIHGLVTEMDLDFERLNKIAKKVKIPLVIHGGTGLKDDDIRKMISLGVAKINMDTALRIAFMRGLRQNITETDPRKATTSAMDEVQLVVLDYINKFHKG